MIFKCDWLYSECTDLLNHYIFIKVSEKALKKHAHSVVGSNY